MYNLKKNDNGDVWYIVRAGSAYVKASMPSGKALGIIGAASKVEKSDKFDGFEISVNDGEYFFPGEIAEEEDKAYRDEENDHFKKNKWNK